MKDGKTTLVKQLGNVTEDTDVTFEYRLKPIKELLKMVDIDLSEITAFPFQAQITYSALNGSRCVRVITSVMEASSDKKEVEKQADYEILGVNAIQQQARFAKKGDVLKAQVYAKAHNRKMRNNIQDDAQKEQYLNYMNNNQEMYGMMQQMNVQSNVVNSVMPQAAIAKSKKAVTRSTGQANDAMSAQMFKQERMGKKAFKKM